MHRTSLMWFCKGYSLCIVTNFIHFGKQVIFRILGGFWNLSVAQNNSNVVLESFFLHIFDNFNQGKVRCFIGGGGRPGILEFFSEKSRSPPTSWNRLMYDRSEIRKEKLLNLPPPPPPHLGLDRLCKHSFWHNLSKLA